jgi:hypothetical protein
MANNSDDFGETIVGLAAIVFIVVLVAYMLGCDWVRDHDTEPSACPNCGSTRGYFTQKEAFPSPIFHTRCKDCQAVK